MNNRNKSLTGLLLDPGQDSSARDSDVECGGEVALVGNSGADQESLLVVGLSLGPRHNPDQRTSAVSLTSAGRSKLKSGNGQSTKYEFR